MKWNHFVFGEKLHELQQFLKAIRSPFESPYSFKEHYFFAESISTTSNRWCQLLQQPSYLHLQTLRIPSLLFSPHPHLTIVSPNFFTFEFWKRWSQLDPYLTWNHIFLEFLGTTSKSSDATDSDTLKELQPGDVSHLKEAFLYMLYFFLYCQDPEERKSHFASTMLSILYCHPMQVHHEGVDWKRVFELRNLRFDLSSSTEWPHSVMVGTEIAELIRLSLVNTFESMFGEKATNIESHPQKNKEDSDKFGNWLALTCDTLEYWGIANETIAIASSLCLEMFQPFIPFSWISNQMSEALVLNLIPQLFKSLSKKTDEKLYLQHILQSLSAIMKILSIWSFHFQEWDFQSSQIIDGIHSIVKDFILNNIGIKGNFEASFFWTVQRGALLLLNDFILVPVIPENLRKQYFYTLLQLFSSPHIALNSFSNKESTQLYKQLFLYCIRGDEFQTPFLDTLLAFCGHNFHKHNVTNDSIEHLIPMFHIFRILVDHSTRNASSYTYKLVTSLEFCAPKLKPRKSPFGIAIISSAALMWASDAPSMTSSEKKRLETLYSKLLAETISILLSKENGRLPHLDAIISMVTSFGWRNCKKNSQGHNDIMVYRTYQCILYHRQLLDYSFLYSPSESSHMDILQDKRESSFFQELGNMSKGISALLQEALISLECTTEMLSDLESFSKNLLVLCNNSWVNSEKSQEVKKIKEDFLKKLFFSISIMMDGLYRNFRKRQISSELKRKICNQWYPLLLSLWGNLNFIRTFLDTSHFPLYELHIEKVMKDFKTLLLGIPELQSEFLKCIYSDPSWIYLVQGQIESFPFVIPKAVFNLQCISDFIETIPDKDLASPILPVVFHYARIVTSKDLFNQCHHIMTSVVNCRRQEMQAVAWCYPELMSEVIESRLENENVELQWEEIRAKFKSFVKVISNPAAISDFRLKDYLNCQKEMEDQLLTLLMDGFNFLFQTARDLKDEDWCTLKQYVLLLIDTVSVVPTFIFQSYLQRVIQMILTYPPLQKHRKELNRTLYNLITSELDEDKKMYSAKAFLRLEKAKL